jgi:tRNA pseudouridine38-40 synthase
MMMRWKCVCSYDGGSFHGWQSQANARGVQDEIEEGLATILKQPVRIHCSGRTDTGVHALGQVFHFDADWRHGGGRLVAALRTRLPPSILVKSAVVASPDFHARFDAVGKRYHYRIIVGAAEPHEAATCLEVRAPLVLGLMEETAGILLGRHDFAPFSASNGDAIEDTTKDLRLLRIASRGRRIRVTLEASGFLYHMARSIVGVLLSVGMERLDPSDVRRVLESGIRIPKIETAPAHGLFLERVFYPRKAARK